MDSLAGLNPQQRRAVTAPAGPVLVLAGPGSGKTRVLTHRLVFQVLELGARPSEIMAVTFTNKAAREMQSRVERLLHDGAHHGDGISLSTFHAFCARLLRREVNRLPFDRSFVIFDESDQRLLLRQALKDLNLDPKREQPGKIHAAISSAKNELIEAKTYIAQDYSGEIVRRVYQRYQELLLVNNGLDFDDLLLYAVGLLRDDDKLRDAYQAQYRHILVDEFQDTNTAQYVLLRQLAGSHQDLFVVGDADQSIYRWRGADYRNVRRFEEDFPQAQTILLEQNYRSTQTILDVASAVIDRQSGRPRKRLFTERGMGDHVVVHEAYDEADEAQFVVDTIALLTAEKKVDPGDCAVMYRTNAQSRSLEEAFLRAGLPYRLVGAQRFYGRREVKDLVAYLRILYNPSDQVSLLRVLNVPARGIGAKSVGALLQGAGKAQVSPAQVLLDLAGGDEASMVTMGGRTAQALSGFGRMLAGWVAVRDELSLVELIDRILADTRYQAYLDDGSEEGLDRWANVLELRNVAQEFEELGLGTFLEHLALVSDQDTLTEAQNAPTLLTLHAAKGLEFPVVIIIGLDDGILPHQRSFDDAEAMAEERRLLYVGITRAEDRLYLVRAFRRRTFGISSVSEPSRFLYDLPGDRVEGDAPGFITPAQASYDRQTRWETHAQLPTESSFKVGMRVMHPSFGEGIIQDSELDGADEVVTIEFAQRGVKQLIASLAKLEVLDDSM